MNTRFTAVATEVGTGHEHWLSRGRLVDAVRASYALPGVFKPVKINGRWLFDGALVNPIPVSVCRALGARYVIAVNLNFDILGRGSVISTPEALYADADDQLHTAATKRRQEQERRSRSSSTPILWPRRWRARYFNRDGRCSSISSRTASRARGWPGDPPDAMISPRLQDIGLFDFHRAEEAIERGSHAVERQLDDIVRELEIARPEARAQGQLERARAQTGVLSARASAGRQIATHRCYLELHLGGMVLDDIADRDDPDECAIFDDGKMPETSRCVIVSMISSIVLLPRAGYDFARHAISCGHDKASRAVLGDEANNVALGDDARRPYHFRRR